MLNPNFLLTKKVLLLWCIVLAFAIATVIGGLQLNSRITDEEGARIKNVVTLANEALVIYTNQLLVQTDALLSATRQFYLRTGSFSETDKFIDELGFDKSVIENIYLIDAKGDFIVSHSQSTHSTNVADREYFRFHRDSPDAGPYISPVEFGRITNQLHFRVSIRISNSDGSFAGIVIATVNPKAFTQYYGQLNVETQRIVSLLSTTDRKLRAQIPEPEPDKWATPVDSPIWKSLNNSSSGIYLSPRAVDGAVRTFVYKKVGEFPLVMVTGYPESEIRESIEKRLQMRVLGLLPLVVLALLLAVILTIVFVNRDRLDQANKKLADLYQQMWHQAMFDTLTGLPGRLMFFDRFDNELARAKRNGRSFAVLFLDLDGFKQVNDRYGHEAGDFVLKKTAQCWAETVREVDTVARIGGDEFAIIIGDLKNISSAEEVAEKLIETLKPDISLPGGNQCQVGVSIGIAFYPDNGTEREKLIAAADKAMYQSKSKGKNKWTLSNQQHAKNG